MTTTEANEFFGPPEQVGEKIDGTHPKPPIPFKQSTAQLPKKSRGRARLIVEYFFEFSPEFLKEHGCRDGVDYARLIADELQGSQITIDDVEALARKHGDLDWRIEAAK